MNTRSGINELEDGLQRAHLLIVQGRSREAELLLTALAAAYPGSAEIAELTSRAQDLRGGPGGLAGWRWDALLSRDYPGASAYPLLLGLGCMALGIYMAARAVPAALARGLSGTIEIEGKYRMISVPIAGQFTRAAVLLAIAGLCFAYTSVLAKRARTPK